MSTDTTTSWADFRAAEPVLADAVRRRFEEHTHHVLATLRKDGSPRVSGLEITFLGGEVCLGMMPGSWKAKDLLRDPRFALHANPGTVESMATGDAKLSGRAAEVTEGAELDRFRAEIAPPEEFHLFRVDLAEVVLTRVEAEELVVESWRPGTAAATRRRT
ncbi:pyridoxamine 5'-phosphate oxidase family protein [Streptomyces qinzhouensis]|uniref:Pyridoxamine 5'-phosphate oxidase family protein n=1 Tax=Streptomyces qinzhouensis TaxID=2599401 RepID=A0A5B8J8M2_9ACTN|nr:pyridoxamine 5'-phosphate oxidase family protein [Streptomyces qinzhouensis]QDY76271.1 pyridoxamine 5'-phosphate oxidase family protein [Streptomyces qinzhouensis]